LAGVTATAAISWAIHRLKRASPPKQITSDPAVRQRGHRSGQTQFDLLARLLADSRRGSDEFGILCATSDPASAFRVRSEPHPLLDEPAPLFSLLDHADRSWSLADKLKRGPVVLVFYLNYGCDACVSSLFELNADIRMFQALGAEVVAISDDPAELTQQRFKRYGAVSFPVLSDPGHEVARRYSIFRPTEADQPEQLLHGTFVIGQDRRVKWARTGDAPFTPNTALLCELARVNSEWPVAADGKAVLTGTEDQ
jgi:peroxiredoxin